MSLYINRIPTDRANNALQEFPAPVLSLARNIDDNAVASSVVSLNPNTTSLEIATFGGQGAVIRWVPTTENASVAGAHASIISSGLTANFDHYVPAGVVRRFAVPQETGGLGQGGLAGAQLGSVHGLYQRVARINAGITASSVILAQY